MSSFNAKKHSCYRDSIIVAVADSGMSIFAGVAVFSILGYMAEQVSLVLEQLSFFNFSRAKKSQKSWPAVLVLHLLHTLR